MQLSCASCARSRCSRARRVLRGADDRAEVSTSACSRRSATAARAGSPSCTRRPTFGVDLGRYVDARRRLRGRRGDAARPRRMYQVDAVTHGDDVLRRAPRGHARRSAFRAGARRSRSPARSAPSATTSRTRSAAARRSTCPAATRRSRLAYSHSFDQVCDNDNGDAIAARAPRADRRRPVQQDRRLLRQGRRPATTVWHDLSIDTAQATLTQNLSPTMNLQVALYGQILEGFQSNPYRRVRVGGNSPQEHIPDTRARWSLTARAQPLPAEAARPRRTSTRGSTTTPGASIGGDVELAYSQYVGKACCSTSTRASTSRAPRRSSRTRSSTRPSRPPASTSPATASCRRCATRSLGAQAHARSRRRATSRSGACSTSSQFNLKGDVLFLDRLRRGRPCRQPDGHRQAVPLRQRPASTRSSSSSGFSGNY